MKDIITPGDLVSIRKECVEFLPLSFSTKDDVWRLPMLVISVEPDRGCDVKDSFSNTSRSPGKRLVFLKIYNGKHVLILEDFLEIIARG